MLRMVQIKETYVTNKRQKKTFSMNLIKKYIRGFKVHSVYKEVIHRDKINKLMNHFKQLKVEMQT